MPSADIDSSRHLISQPLWIKDPNYFDLQSSTRSDYLWDPRTSRKTEPEGIRARSFKPKVRQNSIIISFIYIYSP